MTETKILQWIRLHLSNPIISAIRDTPFTEDWLAAIACRETGIIIVKQGPVPDWSLFKGDYTQRPKETQKQYHGYGPWQTDTGSYPLWIKAGHWKEPYAAAMMAVDVLAAKRKYIISHTQLQGEVLDRANTAAYNGGEGNVIKVIGRGLDIDAYTANHNYSADVWRLRELYKTI